MNSGPGRAFGYPRHAPCERRVLASCLNNANGSAAVPRDGVPERILLILRLSQMKRAAEKGAKLPPEVQLSLGAELRRSLSGWAYRLPMHLVGLASRARAPEAGPVERSPADKPIVWPEHNVLDPDRLAILDQAFKQAWADLQAVGHPATQEELARCLMKLVALEHEPSLLATKAVISMIQRPAGRMR